jgi:hypothetical protein
LKGRRKKERKKRLETAWGTLVSLVGQDLWVSEKRKEHNISKELPCALKLDTLSELITCNT